MLGIWCLSRGYPPHRFFCKIVESCDRKFKVLFFRVLNFIVTDAMQTLDEHHHRGNAGGGNLGSVVQRTAGHAMALAAGFADGVLAKGNQFLVEWTRGNMPKAFPRN